MVSTSAPSKPSETSGAPPVAKPPHETAERRLLVRELLLRNLSRGEIVVRCQERWTVSAAAVRNDIRRIEGDWAREQSDSLDQQRLDVIRAHKGIRTRALTEGNLPVARLANRDLARWLGLDLGDVLVFLPGGGEAATTRLVSVVDVARALRARREQAALPAQARIVDAVLEPSTNGSNGHG